jgi:hypothetical protein
MLIYPHALWTNFAAVSVELTESVEEQKERDQCFFKFLMKQEVLEQRKTKFLQGSKEIPG